MPVQDDAELIQAFVEEARDHLALIEASLLRLEQHPKDPAELNGLFRSVHTIKGGAGFFGLRSIGDLAHGMENLLSLARSGQVLLSGVHIDTLLGCRDLLARLVDAPQSSNGVDVSESCRELEHLAGGASPGSPPPRPPAPAARPEIPEAEPPPAPEPGVRAFRAEGREFLPQIEAGLLTLRINPDNRSALDLLVHGLCALREGAESLGLEPLATLAAHMEEVLGLAGLSGQAPDARALDLLSEAVGLLARLLEPSRDAPAARLQSLCRELSALGQAPAAVPAEPPPPAPSPPAGAPQPSPRAEPAAEPAAALAAETDESIRVPVKRLNKLIDLAGELVLVRNRLLRLCEPHQAHHSGLKAALHNLNRITAEMQEEIMATRMQPIGVIFNKFPRLIRQLEKDLGKRLELVTEGADVELDKTIIETLADPVTHIIRNMADHGIETPEERLARGKPPIGTLIQKAFHENGQVVIQFSDDGAGMDPEFIAAKALEKGIVSAEALDRMGPRDKLSLVFTPGFSTASAVSAVSGRGIGMDVVRTNIEQIGGTVDLSSEPGKWTSLTMTLPLTMAIISAVIVEAGDSCFAFPQGQLEEMVLLQPEHYAARVGQSGGQRLLSLRGDVLPLLSLADCLGLADAAAAPAGSPEKPLHLVIIRAKHDRVAVIVDRILGSEEIVVKPMPEYFRAIKTFSGTSILGDGAIALIVDVPGFIQRTRLAYGETDTHRAERPEHWVDEEPQSLLIFDNNTEEHFALALSWIRRVDAIDVARIQRSAGLEYIEYGGEQMRLLRLEHCLPVPPPAGYGQIAHIVIPRHAKVPVALLINRVIDSRSLVVKLENTGPSQPGILGSMLIDGHITLMLDLHGLLKAGLPESVEILEVNTERAQTKHILLVEDTPFFRRVIKEFVTTSGYRVTTAGNGREGLRFLEEQDFDLVLSDIEMPVMDGREMIRNIRANPRLQQIPVIALTTLNDAQTVAEGRKAGFNDWLIKLDKELVLKTLADYL